MVALVPQALQEVPKPQRTLDSFSPVPFIITDDSEDCTRSLRTRSSHVRSGSRSLMKLSGCVRLFRSLIRCLRWRPLVPTPSLCPRLRRVKDRLGTTSTRLLARSLARCPSVSILGVRSSAVLTLVAATADGRGLVAIGCAEGVWIGFRHDSRCKSLLMLTVFLLLSPGL